MKCKFKAKICPHQHGETGTHTETRMQARVHTQTRMQDTNHYSVGAFSLSGDTTTLILLVQKQWGGVELSGLPIS